MQKVGKNADATQRLRSEYYMARSSLLSLVRLKSFQKLSR